MNTIFYTIIISDINCEHKYAIHLVETSYKISLVHTLIEM